MRKILVVFNAKFMKPENLIIPRLKKGLNFQSVLPFRLMTKIEMENCFNERGGGRRRPHYKVSINEAAISQSFGWLIHAISLNSFPLTFLLFLSFFPHHCHECLANFAFSFLLVLYQFEIRKEVYNHNNERGRVVVRRG